MATFDQHKQKVNYQYNAAGNINFGAEDTGQQIATELEKLEAEVGKARDANVISKLTAAKASTHLLEAAEEAKQLKPNKKTVLERLNSAKGVLTGINAVAGIIEAASKAYDVVEKTFK
jgi:hypothetical protein